MAKRGIKLSDQIRKAVKGCGQTRYAIAKATGIDQSTLSRFVSGERGLPMNTLDRLADYLELSITTKSQRRRKG
jgi:transcriptional regulator with XRE-family HTH domain